jgi:hypothetical protein
MPGVDGGARARGEEGVKALPRWPRGSHKILLLLRVQKGIPSHANFEATVHFIIIVLDDLDVNFGSTLYYIL